MFNTDRIKENMEIIGADGIRVGTVDAVEGDQLKLTRADSGKGADMAPPRYLATGLVATVEGNQVRLSANANLPGLFGEKNAPSGGPAAPDSSPPVWNWNKIGIGAAIGAVTAGAVGAALFSRKTPEHDDFQLRLETDETLRLIASDKVEGTQVIGRNGETLGQIKSFMVDKYTGRVAYAILTFGGTMGFGNSFFPIPWPMLDFDVQKDGYVLDISKEQLATAPRFEGHVKTEFTPAYRRKLILFYRS